MRYASILMALLAVGTGAAAQEHRLPVTFARAGGQATVEVRDIGAKHCVLSAAGRTWATATMEGGRFTFTVPEVRTVTVFPITPATDSETVIGELVVFPRRPADWSKNITLLAAGTPAWFDQWADATGLPVERREIREVATAPASSEPSRAASEPASGPTLGRGERLLILGRDAAGKTIQEAQAIGTALGANVLVLDAPWLGKSEEGPLTVEPGGFGGEMLDYGQEKWPMPLKFSVAAGPAPAIVNRWAWIGAAKPVGLGDTTGLRPAGSGAHTAPLVEQAGLPAWKHRVVLSYLPWQEQLGRRDVAEQTLLRVMRAAAGPVPRVRWRCAEIVWPSVKDLDEKTRPVLNAVAGAWGCIQGTPPRANILDLRGKDAPAAAVTRNMDWLDNQTHDQCPLLILGDDPVLDGWPWLRLDRDKGWSVRVGIHWLPADALPGTARGQVQLMLKLTELCVPLGECPSPVAK